MSKRAESSPESSRLVIAFNKLVEADQQDVFLSSIMKRAWPVAKVDLIKPSSEVRAAIDFALTDEQGKSRPIVEVQREIVAFTNQKAAETHHQLDKLISLIK